MTNFCGTFNGCLDGIIQLIPIGPPSIIGTNYSLRSLPLTLSLEGAGENKYTITGTVDFTGVASFTSPINLTGVGYLMKDICAVKATITGYVGNTIEFLALITIRFRENEKRSRRIISDWQFLGGTSLIIPNVILGSAEGFSKKLEFCNSNTDCSKSYDSCSTTSSSVYSSSSCSNKKYY